MPQNADLPPMSMDGSPETDKGRAHLSIGEVLSLLQQDYPDITISKIRFLESQGLLDPERTPSGYRKFYDDDVEQLRWVLRQQKENFLPLKVIKDRLAAGHLDGPASDSGVLDLNSSDDPGSSDGPDLTSATNTTSAPHDDRAKDEIASSVTTAGAANGDSADESQPTPTPTPLAVETHAMSRAEPGDAPSVEALVGGTAGNTDGEKSPISVERPMDLGVEFASISMSAKEICAAAGITGLQLADLERYGLVTPGMLGHDAIYGEDALLIANLAGALAAFGLEARHLRMFKTSAEREAGMYEQIALPRLRVNRPDSHRQAMDDVARVAGLAEQLHRALLRDALRSVLAPAKR